MEEQTEGNPGMKRSKMTMTDEKLEEKIDPPFEIYALEMDPAGIKIGAFLAARDFPVRKVAIPFMLEDPALIETEIVSAIGTDSTVLAVYGSGSNHHYTYGLCRRASRLSEEFGYIHIDHHNDWPWPEPWKVSAEGTLNCGSFVMRIVENINVKKKENVLLIGSRADDDVTAIAEREFLRPSGFWKLEKMLDMLPDDAYVTIDLDVMDTCLIRTMFPQGTMRQEELLAILGMIQAKKRIISADVCGLAYTGDDYLGLMLYASIAAKLLGSEQGIMEEQAGFEASFNGLCLKLRETGRQLK